MSADLALPAILAQTAMARGEAQLSMLKAQHDAEQAIVTMLDDLARPAPAPGTGLKVDKSA